MAERLHDYTITSVNRRYPWDLWLDGSPWKLTHGDDFDVSIASIRIAAYAAAKRRGGRAKTSRLDADTLVIQFTELPAR